MTLWKHEIENGNKGRSIQQEYDPQGNLVSLIAFTNDTLSETMEYTYNGSGDILSDCDRSADGKVLERNTYGYDAQGRVLSGYSVDGNEAKSGSFLYHYNSVSHIITFVKKDARDSLEYTIEYSYEANYDSCDYRTAVKKNTAGVLVLRVEKSFDDRGRVREKKVVQIDSNASHIFRYEYSENNVIRQITRMLADGTVEWRNEYAIHPNGTYAEMRSYDRTNALISLTTFSYEYFQ